MAHNTNQTTMEAFFDSLDGAENIKLNEDFKLKLYDVTLEKFYEIWLDNGVLQVAAVGES